MRRKERKSWFLSFQGEWKVGDGGCKRYQIWLELKKGWAAKREEESERKLRKREAGIRS